MPEIYFASSKVRYSLEEIKKGVSNSSLSEYERQTLLFCYHWLNRQQAFTVFTSGSTGSPKPIAITRKQMRISAEMTLKLMHLKFGLKSLICLNTKHIAGKMMLVRGMEAGMEMVVTEPTSNPLSALHDFLPFDFTSFVPMQLQTILETPGGKEVLNHCKAVLVGGAPVGLHQQRLFSTLEAPLYHTYGMTETVSHIALRRMNKDKSSEVYKAFANVELSQDERGCLCIKSPITDYELIKTNDVVELTGKHTFRWLGRFDNMINSGGIKIQSEKIEEIISTLFETMQKTNRFAISFLPDNLLGQKLVLVIEGEKWLDAEIEHLEQLCKNHLEKYHQPRKYIFLPNFPEVTGNKLNRKLLSEWITQ